MASSPDPSRMKGDLARLVAFKTENPPGEEIKAAEFLADLFRKAEFSVSIDQYKAGRANVIARLDNGSGPTSHSTPIWMWYRWAKAGRAIRLHW